MECKYVSEYRFYFFFQRIISLERSGGKEREGRASVTWLEGLPLGSLL